MRRGNRLSTYKLTECLASVGSLRRADEREMLAALAEHTSLALTDARTVEAALDADDSRRVAVLEIEDAADRRPRSPASCSPSHARRYCGLRTST